MDRQRRLGLGQIGDGEGDVWLVGGEIRDGEADIAIDGQQIGDGKAYVT